MMAPRPQELVDALSSRNIADKKRALKTIKNQVIGNKQKKLAFVSAGAVGKLLEILGEGGVEEDRDVVIDSTCTLGSLGYCSQTGANEVLASGAMVHLLRTVCSGDEKVTECGLRSVKLLMQQAPEVRSTILEQPAVVATLVKLLSSGNASCQELAAIVLAKCCEGASQQQLESLCGMGALNALLEAYGSSVRKAIKVAALEAISNLLQHCPLACSQLLGRTDVHQSLLALLKDFAPSIRLLAATCLADLSCAASLAASSSTAAPDKSENLLRQFALPVLLRLLNDVELRAQVPPVLARLIADDEESQRAASSPDCVRCLTWLLADALPLTGAANGVAAATNQAAAAGAPGGVGGEGDGACNVALVEGCLRALGGMCGNQEECRRQVLDAKVMKHIMRALDDPHEGIRTAAALCVRALTRSVKYLMRTAGSGSGGLGGSSSSGNGQLEAELPVALVRLLGDSSIVCQVAAAGALCNLVMEFSCVRDTVLREGGVHRLAAASTSMMPELRLQACWALRNMMYRSEPAVRRAVVSELPWSTMRALLNDPDSRVAEQAMCLLRNFAMERPEHISAALEWSGGELLGELETKLDPSKSVPSALRHHALYAVANMLTGSEAHKDAVLASNLPALLVAHLKDTSSDLVLPSVWCCINFCYHLPDARGSTGASTITTTTTSSSTTATAAAAAAASGIAARAQRLRDLGADELLQGLLSHTSLDVRERAKTALEQLKA